MRIFFKICAWIAGIFLLILAGIIIIASAKDYKPGEQIVISESGNFDLYPKWNEIDLLIWNIGYCGLDADMDFFYDGGKKVRTGENQFDNNLDGIINELKSNDTIEFILLQEVDTRAKRSYNINVADSIISALPGYNHFFALNYSVFFVPVPALDPMGFVTSGILTMGKPVPLNSIRWSFPGKFAWPKSLFMLDRCFLVNRYPLNNGKELLIINTHNSAFDEEGRLRKQEMEFLKTFLIKEYESGNYIIAGGDWNQSPPGFTPEYTQDIFDKDDFICIPDNYLPEGWKWIYDPSGPTNRRLKTNYKRGETPTTIIDFCLISPNVTCSDVKVVDKQFRNSDHQPVRFKFRLL